MSTTGWWLLGFALGGVVVLIAATLLILIIALARRIARQAADITSALDGARVNTEPLFDLAKTNFALERITRSLAAVRAASAGAEPEPPSPGSDRGLLGRIADRLTPGGSEAA